MPSRRACRGSKLVTGSPATRTTPLSGWYWPETILRMVDLPAPFSPARMFTVPLWKSNETFSRTGTPPKDLARSWQESSGTSTGDVCGVGSSGSAVRACIA